MVPHTAITIGLLIFAVFICIASAVGLLFPAWLISAVRDAWAKKFALPTAVLLRIILGSSLIYFAPFSDFPLTLRVFGALGLVAAVGLILIGWQRVDGIINWAANLPVWMTRAWLVFGLSLGALLLYATAGQL